MRVTRTTPTDEHPPYNAIFEPIAEIVDSVFQERYPVDAPGVDFETYVPMPHVEREIVNFAKAQSGEIGLVEGATGIGKSSVLQYIRDKIWKKKGQLCRVLFRDLSNRSYTKKLGAKFYSLPEQSQRKRASTTADDILDGLIKADLLSDGFYESEVVHNASAFRRFVTRYFPEDTPAEAFDCDCDDELFLKSLRKKDFSTFLKISLCYMLHLRDIPHVKVVLDNTDDKDGLLVGSLTEKLAHLHRFVEQFSARERAIDGSATIRCVSPFIACRPTTATMIKQQQISRNGGGWYGFRPLVLTDSAPLYPIIERRYNTFMKILRLKTPETGSIEEQIQKSVPPPPEVIELSILERDWSVGNYDSLYRRIFLLFDRSKQANELKQLCNANIAKSLSATYAVLRNCHFIDVPKLFAEARAAHSGPTRDDTADTRRLFTTTTILQGLAYGNQGNVSSPQYPINNTRIPNLLHSELAPINKTLFKAKVLSAFFHKVASQTRTLETAALPLNDMIDRGTKWFAVSEKAAEGVIDQMHSEELLASARSVDPPSSYRSSCVLHLTPRAWVLWNHLRSNSVLLECYRDAIVLDDEIEWHGRRPNWTDTPTRELNINERARQILWMVVQLWQVEQGETAVICERGEYSQYENVFGDTPVALTLLDGIDQSRQRYYESFQGWKYHEMRDEIEQLREEIRAARTGWRNYRAASHRRQ